MERKTDEIHILGIESSGLVCGVYISRGNNLIGQIAVKVKNIHSERLATLLEQLLLRVQLKLNDLSALAISAGPGSFTGLRIGYSLIKGLGHSLKIPIVEVPTLDIWSYQEGEQEIPVFSIIDAHRNEIYYGSYFWKNGKIEKKDKYHLIAIRDLKKILKQCTLLVGGDLIRIKDKIIEIGSDKIAFPAILKTEPESWAFAEIAYQKFLKDNFSDLEKCEPMYIRDFKGVM